MYGFDLTLMAGFLVLAGNTVQCTVPAPPQIIVNPVSAPVQYEYGLSREQLGSFKSSTVNPYAPGTDTATGGLRHDRPVVKTSVHWKTMTYPDQNVSCLWYDKIEIAIELQPKIYVAKENNNPICRNAILDHEHRHVAVDRAVINRYAANIGKAVKTAVDSIGAMGPYNAHEMEDVRQNLVHHIESTVDAQQMMLHQEMKREQTKVDSLEEYERVSKICQEANQ